MSVYIKVSQLIACLLSLLLHYSYVSKIASSSDASHLLVAVSSRSDRRTKEEKTRRECIPRVEKIEKLVMLFKSTYNSSTFSCLPAVVIDVAASTQSTTHKITNNYRFLSENNLTAVLYFTFFWTFNFSNVWRCCCSVENAVVCGSLNCACLSGLGTIKITITISKTMEKICYHPGKHGNKMWQWKLSKNRERERENINLKVLTLRLYPLTETIRKTC